MHQHVVVAEAVSVLGRAENQPVPERGGLKQLLIVIRL
jgi:hypothetical protein